MFGHHSRVRSESIGGHAEYTMRAILKLFGKLFGRADRGVAQDPQSLDDTLKREGYHRLPGTMQWTPGTPMQVDKANWRRCEHCGQSIPVKFDRKVTPDGEIEEAGTWTYVCAFCSHGHVGSPSWSEDVRKQEACHECGTKLGEAYQCPSCSFPRGWMRVECPYCKNQQPVLAPHWVDDCDMFRLECVRCEAVFLSLCIC
jgi:hypothetical protein